MLILMESTRQVQPGTEEPIPQLPPGLDTKAEKEDIEIWSYHFPVWV